MEKKKKKKTYLASKGEPCVAGSYLAVHCTLFLLLAIWGKGVPGCGIGTDAVAMPSTRRALPRSRWKLEQH